MGKNRLIKSPPTSPQTSPQGLTPEIKELIEAFADDIIARQLCEVETTESESEEGRPQK